MTLRDCLRELAHARRALLDGDQLLGLAIAGSVRARAAEAASPGAAEMDGPDRRAWLDCLVESELLLRGDLS